MIVEAMALLLRQLNDHLARIDGAGTGAPDQIVLGNVAQLDRQEVATELDNHLVLGLVNVEEERTLKNARATVAGDGGAVLYRNPPLHLNLYLLFTANYRNYETGLKRLAQVLAFFQGKQRFTLADAPGVVPAEAVIVEFSLSMDLISLTFEQVNHLWGFLGARQMPSVIYRGRLVAISDQRILDGGGRIMDIALNTRGATA